MKRLIMIPVLFYNSFAMGQSIFMSSDSTFEAQVWKWEFSDVIQIDSTFSQDEVFQQVRQWFSESFVSSKNVLDNIDKDAGVFYGKGSIFMISENDGWVEFNIEVRCKDGRIKYTLRNFYHKGIYRLTLFGTRPSQFDQADDGGLLTQIERPISMKWSGGNADERWSGIKNKSKFETYKLILSLRKKMRPESFRAKDDW